jgi:heme-degrading monooxygenase HmoA
VRSPWKQVRPLETGTEYLVLASSIPPKSGRSTYALFAGSRAVRKQLLQTDGVMGFSMLAEPFRKHYATLSVWRDEEALAAFAAAHPHDELMTDLAPAMGETKFVRWSIDGAHGVPSWDDALERLA